MNDDDIDGDLSENPFNISYCC